jgi:hypothetical protein
MIGLDFVSINVIGVLINEATNPYINVGNKAIIVYFSSLGFERPLPINYPNTCVLANYNASYAIMSPNNETFDIKTL